MLAWLRRFPLWCWWIPLVWIVSLPWPGMATQPEKQFRLVSFTDPADKPSDVLLNTLMYVPFGYSFAGGRRRLPAVASAALAAGAVSASAEAMQFFSTVRYASMTDLTCAVAGAAVGAAWRCHFSTCLDGVTQ